LHELLSESGAAKLSADIETLHLANSLFESVQGHASGGLVVHQGKLSQLKRFKDDAREVVAGQECGMAFENYQDMKVGDVIGVQYEAKKARCKVVWVVDAGGVKKIQAGVQLIADQECPWKAVLPAEVQSTIAPPRHDNRRKFVRHKISFPLELRDERVNTPMRVNATDISGNGCYVETAMPLPVATVLRVDFWIDQERMSATATVRTCDPGVGMGIELTGLPDESKKRFQAHLDKMDPGLNKPGAKTAE